MAPAANDVIDTCEACPINGMTVIELGIFLSVHRSIQPLPSQDICDVVNGWFADTVSCASIDSATLLMRRRGWLAGTRCGFWATEQGRTVARPGDCQDFRVWPGIMGNKESHYVTTQRTCHTE
ncbi:hypothetical protein CP98_04946 [Sphingobium yanoikuyae]|uniref:Uncharacterized protein n=1 Tax=Sphingobium yanoikuyae TaxID=13690 RepID=A0A084E709_SPHYA|nr:hypothetical protein [Sphingobium yanoikuyae]KEZ13751.1 hypothetical protein CP98_04946 [Sphingobium yanoikuyae]